MNTLKSTASGCADTCRFRYTVYGVLFGFCFPLGATIIDVIFDPHGFTFGAIWRAQVTHSLLWIIDTAPFFLGLFANWIGRRQDNICSLNSILEQQIEGQREELIEVNEKLHHQLKELDETRHLYDENARHLQKSWTKF